MFTLLGKLGFKTKVAEASPRCVRGWVVARLGKNRPVRLGVYVGKELIHEFSTDVFRQDVNDRFSITGRHGFNVQIPLKYFRSGKSVLRIMSFGSGIPLPLHRATLKQADTGLDYNVEGVSPEGMRGWIIDSRQPGKSPKLNLYVDGSLVDSFRPDILRKDVNKARNVTGEHGFRSHVPLKYFDGEPHAVHLTVQEDREYLLHAEMLQQRFEDIAYRVEQVEPYYAKGWVASTVEPGQPLKVKVFCNGHKVDSFYTDISRGDVNRKMGMEGEHGFEYYLPLSLLRSGENRLCLMVEHKGKEYPLETMIFDRNLEPVLQPVFQLHTQNQTVEKQNRELQDTVASLEEHINSLEVQIGEGAALMGEIGQMAEDARAQKG